MLTISTQAQEVYEKGKILDSIPVSGTTDESFALYIPNGFKENELSSIVFIFEPAARSVIGIRPFIPAAEKYNHILVCSNNSRNSSYDRNFGIANNLFAHIFSHFNIKEDEMYLSGFSGGSRVACAIASLSNQFAGVVACGAGFPSVPDYKPSIQKYAYVGLVGDRDMNYKEMLKNKDFLQFLKFNNTLITYKGEHSWPAPEQISQAFDWLYLQKLKKAPSKEADEIKNLYLKAYKRIEEFKARNELLRASEQYERTIKTFQDFVSLDTLMQQHQKLLATKAYKKQATSFSNVLKQEEKIANKLKSRMTSDFENPKETNFGWWEKELAKLDVLEEKGDTNTKDMVYRIKFDVFARAYSRKNTLLYEENPEQTALAEQFIKLVYPKTE
ncbi:hypothetical protein [Flagellimonas meridianipacifica]|uniref:hypothetical protein n=1 Tax=Flagellimonas meridianipacifica TaxID=1080225 RepID=UPI000D0635D5|nr:hypothetical protein [Allomuricauda pacifica]